MKCPRCKGTGKIGTKKLEIKKNITAAKFLYKRGYTYSEIAKRLGYKSKRSAWNLLHIKRVKKDKVAII